MRVRRRKRGSPIRSGEPTVPQVLQQLARDHANMAALLDLLDSELEKVRQGEVADFELMRDIMVYMTRYPDHAHHPVEDLMFRRWIERDENAHALAGTLGREHRGLAEKGEALASVLARVVDGAMISREEIETRTRDYSEFLRYHMKIEDERAFPGSGRALRAEDWEDIANALAEHEDPVFGPVVRDEFRDLFASITRNS